MRLSWMALLIGVMNASLPLCASEAIPLWGLGGPVGYATGGAGFGFTPVVANLEVTHLGYGGAGLADELYLVGLWDSRGLLLRSAIVTPLDPLLNQTHYRDVTDIVLSPGETYFLSSVGRSSGLWVGNVAVPADGGSFNVAPQIQYLGYATGLREDGSFPLQFVNNPPAYFVGPNFQFAIVPEPSSLALGLMATLLLTTFGVRPWRRRGDHS